MKKIEALKKEYPKGTKIKLIKMDDPQAPPKGMLGIVRGVDGIGNILMTWGNGSTLSLIPDVDIFEKIDTKVQ